MSAHLRRAAAVAALVLALTGCSAAQDEPDPVSDVSPVAYAQAPPVDLVVDTDLAADALAALAWLLRQENVTVHAVTVPTSGEVGCTRAPEVLGALVATVGVEPPVLACGRTPRGDGGRTFPAGWTRAASLPLIEARPVDPVEATPAELVAELAADQPDLGLLALGPLTEVAAVLAAQPAGTTWFDRVTLLGGRRDDDALDGVAEWNAAADPDAFEEVLAADVDLTVVPVDAVVPGVPGWLECRPRLRERFAESQVPAVWDLAAAAVAVVGGEAVGGDVGSWALDREGPVGRLARTGDGPVRVVTAAATPPPGGACG